MRRLVMVFVCVVVLGLAAFAQSGGKMAADEVIAITKAQWAAEMRKDVAGAMKNVADDYTEFNEDYLTRLDGKGINARLAEAQNGASGSMVAAEMTNEKVQVYGDVAILTYNFAGVVKDKDGKTDTNRAKSTRVFIKKDGQWWLVHANFGKAD